MAAPNILISAISSAVKSLAGWDGLLGAFFRMSFTFDLALRFAFDLMWITGAIYACLRYSQSYLLCLPIPLIW
jgi:hypothetical protein